MSTTFDVYCARRSVIMIPVSLEDRIREIRGRESLVDFVQRAGLNRSTLYEAFKREREKGDHNIDHDTAKRIAEAGGRSIQWVLTGEDTGTPARTIEREPEPPPTLELPDSGGDIDRERAYAAWMLNTEDGIDLAVAAEAVRGIAFHRERQVTWVDLYFAAKRALRSERRPGLAPGERYFEFGGAPAVAGPGVSLDEAKAAAEAASRSSVRKRAEEPRRDRGGRANVIPVPNKRARKP